VAGITRGREHELVILDDGIQVLTGTFRFLVTSMRVREG
jgi:hypothetical protein